MVGVNIEELEMKRESKSINIDPDLWREVRKTAIDMNTSASDLFEEALRERVGKVEGKRKGIKEMTKLVRLSYISAIFEFFRACAAFHTPLV